MEESQVIKMGNPLLRKKSLPLEIADINSLTVQTKIDNLIRVMREKNGAGIAAPQVGILERFFVMEMTENPRYPQKESFPLHIAINPVISPLNDAVLVDSWEGCLSIPNIRGKLKRYSKVRLEAIDRAGKAYVKDLEGFAAVVAQHELDHLDGILFIDRMEDMTYLSFLEEYQKYWL